MPAAGIDPLRRLFAFSPTNEEESVRAAGGPFLTEDHTAPGAALFAVNDPAPRIS
ncbi:hypothetical protein ACU635_27355 [[Actinomadura] parvosata]|uniref:hypothetical protein n=1 Tax=[Actinomadura] parvosata TaxID=1955412 RepID=UPI00406CDA20